MGLFQHLIVFQLQKSDVYSCLPGYVPVHSQYNDFNVINVSNLGLGPLAQISSEKNVLDFCQMIKVL